MSESIQNTRGALLDLLLRHKAGLPIDEMAAKLGVSRNAVRQHLATLDGDGLVAVGDVRRNVGRPTNIYTLTALGLEQFPRQYSLLSSLTLTILREQYGPQGVQALLNEMAARLAAAYGPQVKGTSPTERAESAAGLLHQLGYAARAEVDGEQVRIVAVNCVYHHLAQQFPEVCTLDVDLVERLVGVPAAHTECMVRGGSCCRFSLAGPEA